MSYDVGSHIDLTHINKRVQVKEKKSIPQQGRALYDVGTQFVFRLTPAGFKASIRIPVAMA